MLRAEYRKKLAQSRLAVSSRIEFLINKAEEVARKDLPLANRYVTLARNLSMRLNVHIPSRLKKKYCKHCYTFLVPGVNCRVRTKKSKLVYSCLSCQKFMRFPFVKEKKRRRLTAV
jgi:ribonuclease P protein subunit RPR2